MKITIPMPDENAPLFGTPTTPQAEAWFGLPRGMPRRCIGLLPWFLLLCDNDGIVPLARLAEVTELTRSALASTIASLVAQGLVVRVPPKRLRTLGIESSTVGSHLQPVWGRIFSKAWKQCLNCCRPVKPVRGSRYCATCQATMARTDRSWKAIAYERWVQGRTRVDDKGRHIPESEAAIAYAIHRATGQPLHTRKRVEGDVEMNTEGVVNFLVREGWFVDVGWREIMRNHTQGEEGET